MILIFIFVEKEIFLAGIVRPDVFYTIINFTIVLGLTGFQ